ncbi:MAG: LamG domain-containing protein [Coprobacter sp.]
MKRVPDSAYDSMWHSLGKIFMLMILFLSFGIQYVSARHNWPNEVGDGITTRWHPDEGYIYLKIPVWDDDGSDILDCNAGFSPKSGWLDLQLGTSTYRIYCDGGNGDGDSPSLSRSNGDETAEMAGTPRSGDVQYMEIKWYIKNSQLNKEVSMSFNGSWWNRGATADQDINGYTVKVTTTAEMPKLTLSSPEFTQDNSKKIPQVSIKWSRSGGTGAIQEKGNIHLRKDSSTGDIIATQSALSTSGTFMLNASDIDLSKENRYVITQDFSVQNISLSSISNTVTLDAYPQASKLEAAFDESTRQINVTWSVPGTASSNYVKDNFILSYSHKLNGAASTTTEKVSVPYEFGQTSYSYAIDVPENSTGQYSFFLIRETTQQYEAWNDTYRQKVDNLQVSTIHLTVTDAHAVLLENGKALIYWKISGDNWSNGSKFVLTRQNITLNTVEDIEMPKSEVTHKPLPAEFTTEEEYNQYEQYFKGDNQGAYIDDMLQLCSEYRYKLQVKPNANTYSPLAAIHTPETFIPTDQGDLKPEMSASKGYFTDRVEISWSTEGAAFDNFSVRRRIYDPNAQDDSSFEQITSVPGAATQSYYSVEDKNCVPGVIYEYKIVGLSKCANETVESETQPKTIGFRSPVGQIIGRITFDDGQAVEGVDVQVSSRESIGGQSIKFKGTDDSYLETDKSVAQTALPYTIQAYVKPASDNVTGIILKKGNYEVGLESGIPYFKVSQGSQSAKVSANEKLNTGRFSHISAVYQGGEGNDELYLYLCRENTAGVDTILVYKYGITSLSIAPEEGKVEIGKGFNGYIDEVRVWDAALTQEDITGNYNRLLAGNEDNLQAYWRFNESVVTEFYDLSYHGTRYNENHGKIYNADLDSDVVPSPEQLSFRGVTDKSGNYRIIGIPYSGDGTEYTLTPYYGTHQFSPGEKTIVIGHSSMMFNIDFVDQSSFDLSGIVYYNNSTIPVEGVMFYIDGKVASKSNGEIITSNEKGEFEIQVPVGQHEVKASKQNHTFVNDGKLQNSFNADLDYQDNMANVRFWDATRVRLIGRIAGGAVQDTIPLGHSLSKNNLGEKVSLQLKLNDDSKGKIYYYKDENTGDERTEEEITVTHFHPEHKNTVKSDASFISIVPDPETGEFVADLIPEQYKISNISVTGYSGLSDANILDLTNAFSEEKVIYTSEPEDGGVVTEDTVKYNKSYKYIHREEPTLTISQVNGQGKTQFGSADYKMMNLAGGTDLISLYDENEKTYLMGKPVFEKGKTYKIKIDAYEEYPFYKEPQGGGVPEISDYDRVPVSEGSVSVTNGFAGKTNELYALDENDRLRLLIRR